MQRVRVLHDHCPNHVEGSRDDTHACDMTSRPPTGALPEYEHPPVSEVALTVQLVDDIGFRSLDMATIAACWEHDLPHVEERDRLPRLDDDPDHLESKPDHTELHETPRLWLQNESGNHVLQLQQDRIAVNWSKSEADDDYPRYETIRDFLLEAWRRLEAKLADLGLTLPPPWMCQVMYVNELGANHGWNSSADTVRLIAPWAGSMSDDFLPVDRHEGLLLHFHIPEHQGWMNIDGRTADIGNRILVLTLASQGWPASPDLDGVLGFMDLAHEWIVKGFTSVTTPEAHQEWGRVR